MMKSLLLVAVALVLVFSVPQVYHELHPVTIQPNQGAYFQIINKEIPKGGVLNGNVTIYVDGELNDDVVVCLNKFYGLPPLGNYNTQTCDVYLVFVGTPKPSTTHETTSTTQISSESSVESTSGATSDHSTSESTGATSDLSTSESTTPSTESTTQHETTSTSDAESTSTTEVVTSTTEEPTSTSDAESTSTTEVVTSTTEQPSTTHDTTSTTQVSTSTTKVATSTSTTKVATSTSTTEQPTTTHETTSTTQVSTSTTKVATSTSTTEVATSTSTTEIATSTSTTEVATSTSTTEQPTTTHETTSTTQVATSTTEVSSTTTPQQHFRRYVTLSQMAYEFLKTDLYNVGVYFLNTPAKGAKLTFSLGFNGTYCAAKTTGPNCENTIADLGDATTFVLGTQPAYYTFTVNSNTDAKHAVSNLTLNFASASFVNIYASSYAVPTADNRDFYGNSTLSIPVPTPGTWYVTVAAGVDGDNVTYSNKTQTASVASTLLNVKEEKYEAGKIKAGTPKYYSINLNTSDSFSVTIKTEAAVTLYAGFNRVPQLVNGNWAGYDITGCNLFNCSAYKNIKSLRLSPNPVNGTWFVAVVSGTTEEKDYTIWYQFDCPFNCSGNGVCQTDKSNFGLCKCNGNFEGLTCGEDNMIIEYIILIIIAALVLVSALLGLIAWAYMRRRSQYVEVK